MARDLYVRVNPKSGAKTFYRCALLHTLLWVFHQGLEDATAQTLEGEQMLETSKTKPDDFDTQVAEQVAAEAEEPVTAYDGLTGSSTLPVVIKFEGDFEIEHGELVKQAFAASHLSVDGWNGLPKADRDLVLESFAEGLRDKAKQSEAGNQIAQTHAGEIETLKQTIATLTSERDTARTTLATVTAERDGLNTSVSTLQSDLKTANSKISSLEAELKAAKAKATAKPKTSGKQAE